MKISDIAIAESPRPRIESPRIDESVLVLPDVEIPYHNAQFVTRCIKLAIAWKIRHCVWLGDFLHLGSLAKFSESDKDTQREIEEIEEALAGFLAPFQRITWTAGNHDRRPQTSLDRIVGAEKVARLFVPDELANEFRAKVKAYDTFHCRVGDDWLLEHPDATNKVPANAARGLANIYDCNVAMGHNHLLGLQQSDSGKHIALEIGCCVDWQRLPYVQNRHRNRPRMSSGALILRHVVNKHYPTLLNDDLIDWKWEMRGCENPK